MVGMIDAILNDNMICWYFIKKNMLHLLELNQIMESFTIFLIGLMLYFGYDVIVMNLFNYFMKIYVCLFC
jgi:hypothetical protein